MITVVILINGQPIYTRTAMNIGIAQNGNCGYELDNREIIEHKKEDGAVALAIKMLKTPFPNLNPNSPKVSC